MLNRIILVTLLLLLSGEAPAVTANSDWVAIGNSGDATVYFDPATIRRKGNVVKIWELFDYKTMQTTGTSSSFSTKHQVEFDCVEERFKVHATVHHAGHMGNGIVTSSNLSESNWNPVVPGSVSQTMWGIACTKK